MYKSLPPTINLNIQTEVLNHFSIEPSEKIYFHLDKGRKKVFEIVNSLLTPYGFGNYSEGQFKRIAGGSSNSSNKIADISLFYWEASGTIL